MQRHFNLANCAGYPAIAMPNGFQESGSPTGTTFYACDPKMCAAPLRLQIGTRRPSGSCYPSTR